MAGDFVENCAVSKAAVCALLATGATEPVRQAPAAKLSEEKFRLISFFACGIRMRWVRTEKQNKNGRQVREAMSKPMHRLQERLNDAGSESKQEKTLTVAVRPVPTVAATSRNSVVTACGGAARTQPLAKGRRTQPFGDDEK